MNIEIEWDEMFDTYDVKVDGVTISERLSQDEIESMTIKEIVELSQESKKQKYVVMWDDGYPSCFYETIEEARQAIRECEIGGKILTMDEYLK